MSARTKDTTTTTGTGTLTLAGAAPTQFQTFNAGIGDGGVCDICILDGNGTDWETDYDCVYTNSSKTLTRGVFDESSTGSRINLSATTHTVFISPAAHRLNKGGGMYQALMSPVPTASLTGLSTWYNQTTSATATDTAVGIQVVGPSNGSAHDLAARKVAVPATPYSISALISLTGPPVTNFFGMVFGWSDGTKYEVFELQIGASPLLSIVHASTHSGAQSNSATTGYDANYQRAWYKLYDDGTNVNFQISLDGVFWYTVYTVAKSSGFLGSGGYSNIIFGTDAYSNKCAATLMSWTQGTS